MLSFREFIEEGLNFRQKWAVGSWGIDRVDYGLQHGKASKTAVELSKGIIPEGKNHVIIDATPSVMNRISDHLSNHGYELTDYENGMARNTESGQVIKVGKVLGRTKAPDTLKRDFENDDRAKSQKMRDYHILISREMNDIASCSTDKPWVSCAQMDKNGGLTQSGSTHLPDEIREGTHVAYLIPKKFAGLSREKQIDKAVSRIMLKPYLSEEGHRVLVPENKSYSTGDGDDVPEYKKNISFIRTMREFTDKHFPMKDGEIYQKHDNVYNDDGNLVEYSNTKNSIDKLLERPNLYHHIADSSQLDSEQLHKITDHFISQVKEWKRKVQGLRGISNLMDNTTLGSDHINKLLDENNKEIDDRILNRDSLSKENVEKLFGRYFGGGISTHLAKIAQHRNTSPEMIDKLVSLKNRLIDSKILDKSNITPKHFDQIRDRHLELFRTSGNRELLSKIASKIKGEEDINNFLGMGIPEIERGLGNNPNLGTGHVEHIIAKLPGALGEGIVGLHHKKLTPVHIDKLVGMRDSAKDLEMYRKSLVDSNMVKTEPPIMGIHRKLLEFHGRGKKLTKEQLQTLQRTYINNTELFPVIKRALDEL